MLYGGVEDDVGLPLQVIGHRSSYKTSEHLIFFIFLILFVYISFFFSLSFLSFLYSFVVIFMW